MLTKLLPADFSLASSYLSAATRSREWQSPKPHYRSVVATTWKEKASVLPVESPSCAPCCLLWHVPGGVAVIRVDTTCNDAKLSQGKPVEYIQDTRATSILADDDVTT